ncbi:hypothetical protein CRM22_008179 [Opisthorchis felineus]|nr:hypothetical protein CRM22_008179 [Opisthorchis felineus]
MSSIPTNHSLFWSQSVDTNETAVAVPTSVAYFQVAFERDATGYGIRVCGYKPVSVHSVREGGSADLAGVQAGDQIIKVNGLSVEDMPHDDVVKQIRAKPTVCFLLRRQRYGRAQSAGSLDEHETPKPFRLLTANEDPVLRTQSRRFQSKRRSSRESTKGVSGTAAAIKRRSRMAVSLVEPLQSGDVSPRMESVSDSAEQYTDEDLEPPRRASVESLHEIPLLLEQQQKSHSRSLKDVREENDHHVELPPSTESGSSQPAAMVEAPSPSQAPASPAPTTTPLPPPSGHVMGRNFDDESDDDLHTRDELMNLSNLFSRSSVVLNSPERTGVFINYLLMQNMDLAPSLFFLVNRYYQRAVLSSKELAKDYRRLCLEIFSTFMHPKSPLHLDLPAPVIQEISQQMRQSSSVDQCFASAVEPVLNVVQNQLNKLCREIQHGITTWRPQESINLLCARNYEEQLTIFELCLTARLQALLKLSMWESSNAQGSEASHETEKVKAAETYQAIVTCLVTAYRFFAVKGGTESADSGSGSVSRGSLFARSVENLTSSSVNSGAGNGTGTTSGGVTVAGSSLWTKLPHFGAKMKQKSHGHLLMSRKPKYMVKNHVLQERALEEISYCSVCSDLIWGLSPQSLSCCYCDLNVHQKCRAGVRDVCSREGRKSLSSSIATATKLSPPEAAVPQKVVTGIPPSGPTTQDVAGNSTSVDQGTRIYRLKVRKTSKSFRMVSDLSSVPKLVRGSLSNLTTATDTGLFDATLRRSGSQASIPTTVCLSNKPSFSSVDSHPGPSELSLTDDGDSLLASKPKSFGDETADTESRHVLRMKNRYDGSEVEPRTSLFRKESISSVQSVAAGQDTMSDSSPRTTAIDAFPELVTTNWSDDPEMIASESFEAAVELRYQFPNYEMPAKGIKSEDYIRTLCLLEFHQKTQYMVRHLKQYEYLLIRPWPAEHQILAQELCLDRIPKLIDLFRSLVTCIDRTKTAQGYVGMAEAVLAWLTDNSKANLKIWAQHCQALSCTNMLDCVSKWVRDYAQRHPDIVRLLQTRHNKFVLLDGLKHMRILYFNLPLIANNIVKDLDKKTKSYRGEAKIWQQIHGHLASLPQTIDDVCMPLVKKINNGQLQSSLDRKDAIFRQPNATVTPYQELLLNFPRMLFRYWVAAHAEVAVDRLTVTSANKVNHDYVRERTDMLIILLHSALLLLVKDNERYVLRAFKATREHAGGGLSATGGAGGGTERSGSIAVMGSFADRLPLSSSSFSGTATSMSNYLTQPTGSLGSFSGAATVSQLSGAAVNPGTGLVSTVANMAGASISERPSGSGSLKLAPILLLHNMFTSRGEKFGGEHLLNIVSMDPPVLVRVLFFQEKQRQNWFQLLQEQSPMVTHFSSAQQQQRGAMSLRMGKTTTPMQMLSLRNARLDQFPEVNENEAREEEAAQMERGPGESGEELSPEFIEQPQQAPTVPIIEHSDSTSSMEEEINPLDRVHMSINACNRMNQQMRRDLCESLRISETEFDKICKSLQLDEAPSLEQILLLQVDIMHNWLCFLSRTYTMALRRREDSRTLKPQTSGELRQTDEYTLFPEACKRPSLFSLVESFRTTQQDGSTASTAKDNSDLASVSTVANSQLSRPFASSLPDVEQTCSSPSLYPTARQLGVSVQDSRRSRRRTVRSSSMIEREVNAGPDRYSMIQMWQLVSQMANTIRQFTKLTNSGPQFGQPLRRSISDPDTPISSRLSSLRCPKSSEDITKDHSEALPSPLATDTVPQEELDSSEATEGSEQRRVNEFPEPELSPAKDSGNCSFPATRLIDTSQSDCTLSLISESPAVAGTRDSGCLPSATDDDEENQDMAQNAFLDPIQRCSTPTDDGEPQRTPTADVKMLELPTSGEDLTGAAEPNQQESTSITDPELKSGAELSAEGRTDNVPVRKVSTCEILVARNDSQKSTTSSGFVED